MTSRRSFLSLLALAPIAPALARSAPAQPSFASGGFIGEMSFGIMGEAVSESTVSFEAYKMLTEAGARPNEKLKALMHSPTPWSVPNRLLGASINEDGCVI
jgi:hypothetical protein